jgi:NAD(P)H-nitrite reductase large subunit
MTKPTVYVLYYSYDEDFNHPFRDPVTFTEIEDVYAERSHAETAKMRRSKKHPQRTYHIGGKKLK